MRDRLSIPMMTVAGIAAMTGVVISASIAPASAQAPAAASVSTAATTAPSIRTPWGEPDLQGIWTDETDTPLQRAPQFADQEFFTDAQRTDLDRQRSALMGREKRAERGTDADVAGAYNDVFTPKKRTGVRTSRIVDPPNGRLPAMTPKARQIAAASANSGSPCCGRPTPAKTRSGTAPAARTIRRPRRASRRRRRATTPCA
jgi:hypothetical protein